MGFITSLFDSQIPFLMYALLAGIFSSISFGVVGTLVVTKRITYLAGSISHCVLGGIGLGLFVQGHLGWQWFTPMLGALLAALSSAVIVGIVSIFYKEREDTVIGALWAMGMALGLIFIAKTPGYIDPMSYLFGNILLVSLDNIWMILLLDFIVIAIALVFYRRFLAICFDEEFARIRGIKTQNYYILLLILTAITIVTLVYVVGIVLVIALLTVPAAVASRFSKKLWQTMILAALFCMGFNIVGIATSYYYDLPSGATIILVSVLTYFVLLLRKS